MVCYWEQEEANPFFLTCVVRRCSTVQETCQKPNEMVIANKAQQMARKRRELLRLVSLEKRKLQLVRQSGSILYDSCWVTREKILFYFFIIHTLVFQCETSPTNWIQDTKFPPNFKSLEINWKWGWEEESWRSWSLRNERVKRTKIFPSFVYSHKSNAWLSIWLLVAAALYCYLLYMCYIYRQRPPLEVRLLMVRKNNEWNSTAAQ